MTGNREEDGAMVDVIYVAIDEGDGVISPGWYWVTDECEAPVGPFRSELDALLAGLHDSVRRPS